MITLTNRAITTAFNYVILLGITSLLVSGLIMGVSGLVSTQETDAIHTEFKVHGNQLANDISTVSYLASRTTGAVSVSRDLPRRVVGNQYTVSITETGDLYQITMRNEDPSVLVTVRFKVHPETTVEETTVNGGALNISATDTEVTVTNE